jgi:hypothetical protein
MLGLEGFSDLVGRLAAGRITGGPGLLPELVERLQQGSASGHFDDDVSIVEFGFP